MMIYSISHPFVNSESIGEWKQLILVIKKNQKKKKTLSVFSLIGYLYSFVAQHSKWRVASFSHSQCKPSGDVHRL